MKITPPKKILLAKGWTQNEIVQATGRHKSEVSAVLNGSRYTRTVQEDIARVVGMPLEELFGLWAWSNRRRKKTQILEEVNDAVFLADIKTGFILDANTRAEMLLGIPVFEGVLECLLDSRDDRGGGYPGRGQGPLYVYVPRSTAKTSIST